MDITQHLIDYYKGERAEAVMVASVGVTTLIIAIVMGQNMSENQQLKGLFYSIAFLSILTLSTGGYGIVNNSSRLRQFPRKYASNPKEFIKSEVDRFDGKNGVNTWWMPLKITWAILIIVGMALSFSIKSEFINGVAIGLLFIGALGFVIDGFAHQRAKLYTAVLLNQIL